MKHTHRWLTPLVLGAVFAVSVVPSIVSRSGAQSPSGRGAAPLAVSTFKTDDEGWTKAPDASCQPRPCYSATSGHPGGAIFSSDSLQGVKFYYRAPAKFLGNKLAAY